MNVQSLGSLQAVEARVHQLESLLGVDAGTASPSAHPPSDDASPVAFKQVLGRLSTSNRVPQALSSLIDNISADEGVDADLVKSVVQQESGFNPQAVSKAGAMGLMQLMPQTAKQLGVSQPFNSVENLTGGVKYLKQLINRYQGNVPVALAAYNAGPGAVDKYGGVPPYKETRQYVKSILSRLQ